MLNSSHMLDFVSDPKLIAIDRLIRECYTQYGNHSRVLDGNGSLQYGEPVAYCPRTFDGFACWDETPASAVAVQACPDFVVGFDPNRTAFKTCTDNGTWLAHPLGNKPWTNYTNCIDYADLEFRNLIQNIYVGGYSVSLVALVISLFIFAMFRSLRNTRTYIHIHLFISFALNNIMWILWYHLVINKPHVVLANEEWCQALHVAVHYFMVTNYMWMFNEGLHLHIALVFVFLKDRVPLRLYVLIGWGLPLLIVSAYAAVRYNLPRGTVMCWIEDSDAMWIIKAPVMLSLFLSMVFLVNVVRVLLTKLVPPRNQRASEAIKKATKATLLLIPLFGLHFMLIPLRPDPASIYANAHQIFSALLTSLQGGCVAVLFCFNNQEVQAAVRGAVARRFRRDDVVLMTGMSANFF
ncbi:hypothetical protein O0L34_g2538 [Tuta absoluta]|nr:hypothetical protein O0L34_g2538 [Tuta absoluta]